MYLHWNIVSESCNSRFIDVLTVCCDRTFNIIIGFEENSTEMQVKYRAITQHVRE